ncbi:alpha/beta hydrolase family protein [Pseudonocardia asaccharolytica]|uniref:Lipase n=1 Tax=Pseudonocardia asaccharolytica DSM 44247 = NBRC 16224 TaxID=1123024 RepID=A0A511D7F6_9PSEU|nr:prolyl oligopeptidase family serine peptidase [Pseudonocardia asaccharolytica]GEL20353.1 lipase [Pseudonocardia asaccharolytica DSM 44247 = NBRC 16224]
MSEDRSVLTREAPPPDRVLRYGPEPDHVVDVRDGRGDEGARPLVALVHGGFWRPRYDRLHVRPMTAALAEAGWSTAAIEYRRIPGRPDLSVADVATALHGLAELTGRPLLPAGHSAGGHLVLHAAAEPVAAFAGVVALAPVADLLLAERQGLGDGAVAAFLGATAASRPDLDPVRRAAPACAVQIVHGDADEIVPVAVSESYRRAHPAAVLHRVDAGHFALIDPRSPAWAAVLSALADLDPTGPDEGSGGQERGAS